MKLFKSTLALAALLTIGSVCAKDTTAKKAAPAAKKAAPVKKTAVKQTAPKKTASRVQAGKNRAVQAAAQPASGFQQLRAQVLGMNQANVIDGKKLSNQFIAQMRQAAVDAELNNLDMQLILQVARDKFVPFTGNDATDLQLLMTINKQIDDTVAQNG